MGLLVDLTNTTRFYDRNDIEKEGIKYVKLQCKGYEHIRSHKLNINVLIDCVVAPLIQCESVCFSHGECPAKETTAMFIRLCENFMEKNPTELIGKETIVRSDQYIIMYFICCSSNLLHFFCI